MDAERTGKRGPHQADTPPRVGNYVTARVGNYVTDNPSNLGKYVTADTRLTADEYRLYSELVEGGLGDGVRLEQERVDWSWVEQRLRLAQERTAEA